MWTKDSVFCLLLSNDSRLPSATSVCGSRFSSFTCPFDLWPEWSNSSWRRTTSEWMTEVEFTRTYIETRWRGGCCCGPVVVLKEARMNIWRTRVFNHHTRTGFDPFPGMFPSSSLLSSTHSRPHMDTLVLLLPFITSSTAPPFCVPDVVLVIADGLPVGGAWMGISLKLATFINLGHPQ